MATVTVWVSGSNLRAQLDQQLANLGQQLNVARAQLQASPQLAYVAVLQDEKFNPSMLVTFDPRKRTLSLQRVDDFQEGADKSLQLWALPPSGGPRSLGVLGAHRAAHGGRGRRRQRAHIGHQPGAQRRCAGGRRADRSGAIQRHTDPEPVAGCAATGDGAADGRNLFQSVNGWFHSAGRGLPLT